MSDTLRGMLKWTNRKPIGDGWYWFRFTPSDDAICVLIQTVAQSEYDEPLAEPIQLVHGVFSQQETLEDMAEGCEWAGPIPEPE